MRRIVVAVLPALSLVLFVAATGWANLWGSPYATEIAWRVAAIIATKRSHYRCEEPLVILRKRLLEVASVSSACSQRSLQPPDFSRLNLLMHCQL